MTCQHQFVHLSEVSKGRPGVTTSMHGVAGAEVGCALCGEVRRVWSDGTVEITNLGFTVQAVKGTGGKA